MKKTKILIVLVFLFAITLSLRGTYAYYVDSYEAKVKLSVASWIIKVNSSDITLKESHEFSISDIVYNTYRTSTNNLTNSNNKFAPGMTSSFVIAIDARESMVALEYDLSLSLEQFNNPNIVVKSVEADNGTLVNNDGVYHGFLDLNKVQNNIARITVTIEWLDNEDHQDEDNNLGRIPLNSIKIPVDVSVNQYVG